MEEEKVKKDITPEEKLQQLTNDTMKKYEKFNRPDYFKMMMDGEFLPKEKKEEKKEE